MTESLCKKLQLDYIKVNIPLSGVNQASTKISQKVNTIVKSRTEEFQANVAFLILPLITQNLPLIYFNKNKVQYPHLPARADEAFNVPKQIDLLLGIGLFYDLLKDGKLSFGENMPILKETRLGWIFAGQLMIRNENVNTSICHLLTKATNKDIDDTSNKFWMLEK